MNKTSDEQQNAVRKYLLGSLDDKKEMRWIEEKILLDDDFTERLSVAEDELINDYLDGSLIDAERERFLRFFLISPENKEKLRLIQNLRKYGAKHSEEKAVAARTGWRKLLFLPALRFAAAILLLIGIGYGVWRTAFYQSDADRGLAELRQAYRGQRPTESRLTAQFDYAPPADFRGAAAPVADAKAHSRAEGYLLHATENSSDAKAHHNLGLLYLAEKKFDLALDEFNQALSSAPGDAAAVFNDIGAAFLEKAVQAEAEKRFDESIEEKALGLKSLNRALEIDPAMLEALFNRALVLQKMPVVNQAQEAWGKYLEKDPASPWAEEARKNLEILNRRQSDQPKDKSQILRDFLDAYRNNDHARAWTVASQTKELVTGVMIEPQLARLFLEAKEESRTRDAEEIRSAFVYLGNLEKQNAGDWFFEELADYYSRTNQTQRQTLREAHRSLQEGYQLILKSDWKGSLEAFQKAKKEFTDAGNRWEASIAEYEICYCLCQAGQIGESTERLLTLSDFCRQKNYRWVQTLADGWLGSDYDLLGEQSKAIAYNQKALETATAISDSYNIQKTLNQFTNEYWLIGDKQKALSSVYGSLSAGGGDLYYQSPRQRGRNLLFAAESFYRFKFYDAAAAFAREEVDFSQNELKSPGLSLAAHNHLAIIFSEMQRYPDAFREIEAGFQLANSFSEEAAREKQLAKTRLILAHLQRASNDCREAIENYNQVIQYYQKTEFAVNNYEAQKGRLLCYVMQKQDFAVRGEMPELFNSFDNYRQKLTEAERDSFFDTEQEVYDIATDYAFDRLQDSEQAFNYAENSRTRSLLGLITENSIQPLVLSEFRQKIPPGVQVVYYAVLADKLLIWQISGTKVITAEKTIKASELDEKIQTYTKLLTSRSSSSASQDAARELYGLLIQPIESTLEPNKLLCIIPDKALFRVSFASLVSSATEKYLIEDYPILYAPSATVFVSETDIARQKAGGSGGGGSERILSVGNPSFSRTDYPELADLPDAAREAKEIARLYDSPRIFSEKEATKERISDSLDEADVLHFAGHYVPNSKSPSLSKLLLAEEGELSVEEIMQKRWRQARLVILSACETGVEKFYNGEGAIGAARAFLSSDVPLVVASQWAVDSDSTAELMIKFHRSRKQQGLATIDALRQAQIEMLRGENKSFRQPFYWAGFLPIGGYADY